MNTASRRFLWFVLSILICIPLMGAVIVSAQATPTPILIEENQTGTLTDAQGSLQYSVAVASLQSIEVQVAAISEAASAAVDQDDGG